MSTFVPFLFAKAGLSQTITLLLGGDVAWMETVHHTPFNRHKITSCSPKISLVNAQAKKNISQTAIDNTIDLGDPITQQYPFAFLVSTLKAADMAFVNLETPIIENTDFNPFKFWAPQFRAHPNFANALQSSGIDVVSTANNHALDAGQLGLISTLKLLQQANVQAVGTGASLKEARVPVILERHNIKVAFLAYTETENSFQGFATPTTVGAAPLKKKLIESDIQQVRSQVNHVVVSVHWGNIGQSSPSPTMRKLAHQLLDAGADIIAGHHPHIPYGIEIYQGKPIFYSLGNLIFSYSRPQWTDNILAKVQMTPSLVKSVEVLPISGLGCDVSQPKLLQGQRAQNLLLDLQKKSTDLGATMHLQSDRGFFHFRN